MKALEMKNDAHLEGNIYRNEWNKGVKKDNVNISRLDDWAECGALNAVMMVGWIDSDIEKMMDSDLDL